MLEAVEEKRKALKCLAELLDPIHAATKRSGMTDDEVDALIEDARDEAYSEKHAGQKA